MNRTPKVGVVHDYFNVYAGAERVTKEILNLFPAADVFTLIDKMEDGRGFLESRKVSSSLLNRLPRIERYYRNLFPLFPWAICRFDLSGYDLIISSSHSAAKGVRTKPGQLHICYCHSPARWAWDLKDQYLRESGLDRGVKGRLALALIERFRRWDAKNTEGVTYFIANSEYIRQRIRRKYGRDATVIYPPVDTDAFTVQTDKKDFYLAASRLVWYKKTRLVVEAFNTMPDRKLVVAGGGPQLNEIRHLAGPNVEVLGHVPHEQFRDLMRDAKALVFAAEEDFGIAPVEAQACGTPVIAFGNGGARETVVDGETGLLFPEQSVDAIVAAVERSESIRFNPSQIRANAERFGAERFRREFRQFMDDVLAGHRAPDAGRFRTER